MPIVPVVPERPVKHANVVSALKARKKQLEIEIAQHRANLIVLQQRCNSLFNHCTRIMAKYNIPASEFIESAGIERAPKQ